MGFNRPLIRLPTAARAGVARHPRDPADPELVSRTIREHDLSSLVKVAAPVGPFVPARA